MDGELGGLWMDPLCCVFVHCGVCQHRCLAGCHLHHQWGPPHPPTNCLHPAGENCFLILQVTGPSSHACHFSFPNSRLYSGCLYPLPPSHLIQLWKHSLWEGWYCRWRKHRWAGSNFLFCHEAAANLGQAISWGFLTLSGRTFQLTKLNLFNHQVRLGYY